MNRNTPAPMLIFFVDALGFDYLARRPLLPGFWQAELPLETLLGYSSSIVPSLWCGLLPDQMGAWNEFYYQPRRPYYLLHLIEHIPHVHLRNLLLRALYRIPRLEWQPGGAQGGPPGLPLQVGRFKIWFPHLPLGWHRQSMPGIPAAVEHLFSRSSCRSSLFPPISLGEAGLDARLRKAGRSYRYWFNSHNFTARHALAQLRRELDSAEVFIFATASLDGAGHAYGPHPHLFEAHFGELEGFVLGARELLAREQPATVLLVSDHGMTTVTRRFDLLEWLKPWQLGHDYLAFLDSTMARFWDVGAVPLHEVAERVTASGTGRFLSAADKARYGLNFADNRFGDLIFLLEPGAVISPSFMDVPFLPFANRPVKGMHGYAPEDPSTQAIFLYHGPAPLPYTPRRVTDVAGVICHLLGLD